MAGGVAQAVKVKQLLREQLEKWLQTTHSCLTNTCNKLQNIPGPPPAKPSKSSLPGTPPQG
jgi:hypothetical protein